MKTQYVVRDENILGYIVGNFLGILHASVLRGANTCRLQTLTYIPIDKSRVRPATLKDFETFRVHPGGHVADGDLQ